MATDPRVVPLTSPLAETLLPDVYREEAPLLVAFLKAYMTWAETAGSQYHSRRLLDYGDVDLTPDSLIGHLRAKYLDGVPLPPEADLRLIIKHSLDIFRSRGTPRGMDLFFRLAYGTGASPYYPSTDLFRLSDGRWTIPTYLEVSPAPGIPLLVGRTIMGHRSGAEAFVERAVHRRSSGDRFSYVLYLSNLLGHFQTGERVQDKNGTVPLTDAPRIVGSLNELTIIDGATAGPFTVGETVDVSSASGGYAARARITGVTDVRGTVEFAVDDPGYGYTVNAQVLVANQTLSVGNISIGSNTGMVDLLHKNQHYFSFGEQLKQPLANIQYTGVAGGFANNDALTAYFANSSVQGTGTVLSVTPSNSTAGTLLAYVATGTLNATTNAVFNAANAHHGNIALYTDVSATGNVAGESSNLTITVSGLVGLVSAGDAAFQVSTPDQVRVANARVASVSLAGSNATIIVDDVQGVFTNAQPLSTSFAVATVAAVQRYVGLVQTSNSFVVDGRAPVSGLTSGTTGVVAHLSLGANAGFAVGSVGNTETVSLNMDRLQSLAAVQLGAATYGFPHAPTANAANTLFSVANLVSYTIGEIGALSSVALGGSYTVSPVTRVIEPEVYRYRKRDDRLFVFNLTASFLPGEIVTQATTGARGRVRTANATCLTLKRMSLLKDFRPNLLVTGQFSGATANVSTATADYRLEEVEDLKGDEAGLNAVVPGSAAVINGIAATLEVVDSGFAFTDGETVDFVSESTGTTGVAQAVILREGRGRGYTSRVGGVLSANKRLRDGEYWQEFSYDVRSAANPVKYLPALNAILHVSGTRAFTTRLFQATGDSGLDSPGVDQSRTP